MKFFAEAAAGSAFSSALSRRLQFAIALAMFGAVSIPATTIGCGMAASPQPPSLQLARPVHDLTAARSGDGVDLQWTTPDETTDGLSIRKPVQLRICREPEGAACQSVATIFAAPGKSAEYTDTLTPTLTTGPLCAMTYQILAINKHGRSAGPSNTAETLAGEAPPPVQDFSASMDERGVILRWRAIPNLLPGTSIQLQRKLVTMPGTVGKGRAAGALPPISEPEEQTLQVPMVPSRVDPGTALDTNIAFNRRYQYVATRAIQRTIGMRSIQVAGAPSTAIIIVTRDTFPPAPPSGLAAVPIQASLNNETPEVDLSWSANTEPDLAQYLVYRRDLNSHEPAQQIAPKQPTLPVVAPAFRDTHVQSGHTYAYSVVAVDNAGNRSSASGEVVVTVPG